MIVSELARAASVPPAKVRYYVRIGLLEAARRDPGNGYRRFDAAALARLRLIVAARALGFPLKAVSRLLELAGRGASPCPETRQLLDARLRELAAQRRALAREEARLKAVRTGLAPAAGRHPGRAAAVPAARRARVNRQTQEQHMSKSRQRISSRQSAPAWAWVRAAVLVLAAAAAGGCGASEGGGSPAAQELITVYRSPSCGCCGRWVNHLREQGFAVEVHEVARLNPIRERLGVPAKLASCHTAQVGDYVIEGHVPAGDIRRLLAQRPAGRGLAVPGMPVGSPGMEQGEARDPYQVLLFGAEAAPMVFAEHGPVAP